MKIPGQSPEWFITWVAFAVGIVSMTVELLIYFTVADAGMHLGSAMWALAYVVMTAMMLVFRRPNIIVCVIGAFAALLLSTLLTETLDGPWARLVLVALLFTTGTVLPMFERATKRVAYSFTASAPLLVWLTRTPEEAIVDMVGIAVIVSGPYVAAVYQILSIVSGVRRSDAHKAAVFSFSPIATWEQDYSGVLSEYEMMHDDRVHDLRNHVDANPQLLETLLTWCRHGSISDAAYRVFEVVDGEPFPDPSELLRLGPAAAAASFDHLEAIWTGQAHIVSEIEANTFQGNARVLQIHWAAPLVDGEPDYSSVLIAAIDLTSQKAAETKLAAEILARDEFVASVSHELRTPLTAVVGLAEELAHNPDSFPPEETRELITVIAKEGRDVANIVDDLLAAARLSSEQVSIFRERADLHEIVVDVASQFVCDVDVEVETMVLADPHRVRQILRNLLTNADRYGGVNVSVTSTIHTDSVHLEVRDDGAGIPEHMHDTIFDPYARASSAPGLTESVGLGLTISRDLARLMDGDLTYRYADGVSVFRLTLPMS